MKFPGIPFHPLPGATREALDRHADQERKAREDEALSDLAKGIAALPKPAQVNLARRPHPDTGRKSLKIPRQAEKSR